MPRLCALDALAQRGARRFESVDLRKASFFVVRIDSRVYGYRDLCPHQGTPLAWRKDAYLDAAGRHIVCSAHGALFDVETGLCTLGPCLGQSLTPVPLRVAADGFIEMKDSE